MKQFTSRNQIKGQIAENIACKFLKRKGFIVLKRNFTLSSGEIDIIALRDNVIHFLEVKSLFTSGLDVSYETSNPLEKINHQKKSKIKRASMFYLSKTSVSYETFQYDAIAIFVDVQGSQVRVEHLENAFF